MHNEIISQLEAALGKTITLLSSFNEKDLNAVPFEGSWTAAQVGRHLYKAGNGMDELLLAPTEAVGRNPEEKAQELKNLFLDFSIKMESPDFIVPEEKEYDKELLIASLREVKNKMIPAAKETDLTQLAMLPEGHPLQGHTKLEIVHFVAYHTMRHNHQIEKIGEAL
ncbi:DinB family protein [uncultured Flavobacterium sp.]|uniref:DinB family protein n=1 Tax=uncultured Flavobacterium sp. TaxID=165435 RepID=UPI0025E0A62F|nr:DinB family protein [uncultured Flavobacterium sp.]